MKQNNIRKILIIDDETDQEELLIQSLAYKGFLKDYEFLYAPNGPKALNLLKNDQHIEIALIDINMPEMDGLTLLHHIRQEFPLVQSVIISAYSDMSNIRTAMNKGAYDFVTKPIDIGDLEITLRKTIQYVEELKANSKNSYENQLLKQRSVELEMQALRAQMNPHFIFNSLNSINNYILKKDQAKASEYLLKFSKLIRMILEDSIHPFIPLEQELAALKLYIELESLRFQYKFDYAIEIDKELDISSIKVPPLILQPFVENAIKHGLMPKESPGLLIIAAKQENENLIVSISDDGIGRAKASTLHQNTTNHRSLGIKVTTDRIRLMEAEPHQITQLIIEDLMDTKQEASGTKITIQIPVKI